jgi:hypothetical protein
MENMVHTQQAIKAEILDTQKKYFRTIYLPIVSVFKKSDILPAIR